MKARWLGFVSIALLALVSCSTVDPVTGKRVQNMYLIQDDVQMGREVMADTVAAMRKEGVRINKDAEQVAKLQTIVRRITTVSHMPDLPYQVTLFETNIVNAFAAPGGQMGVFTGLYHPEMGLVKDDDELAAVIAHELAHVTCRHTTEALTRGMPLQLVLLGASIYAESKGKQDLAMGLAAGFLVYQGLVLPKFSRADESEADSVGLMYMAKAGFDPNAAIRIWERAAARGKDPKLFAMFSSHPTDSARASALRKLLPKALAEYERARDNPSRP
ncbi:MAG: M48 family metallopeptidase [Kiritimatiellae bacterium]|nr:M48 family metallopeptidase [Kiritimatiellia bacterium]